MGRLDRSRWATNKRTGFTAGLSGDSWHAITDENGTWAAGASQRSRRLPKYQEYPKSLSPLYRLFI